MSLTTQRVSNPLTPQTYAEAREFAQMLARSDMVPKDYRDKPGNVMVAMQWGYEIGLGPMQALQNISVINGRPSVWGDAALALVRGHPACLGVQEGVTGDGDARHGWCEVTRKGEKAQRRTFSVADAKKANLYGKPGPWQQYPDRMLQLRARGFAIRDVFPDALRGVITTEEALDLPPEPAMPPARGETITSTAEPAPAPIAAPGYSGPPLVVLAPDGSTRTAATPGQWVKWCSAAVLRINDPEELRGWARDMEEHFADLSADLVAAVRAALTTQMEALDDAERGEAPTDDA